MQIIQVPSVFLIKIPGGEWLNLALIRTLEFKPSEEIWITWACGDRQIYSGSKAIAILNAWQEVKCIDKSNDELGAIDAQLLAHGAPPELVAAVKSGQQQLISQELLLVQDLEQRSRLAKIIWRIEQIQKKSNG